MNPAFTTTANSLLSLPLTGTKAVEEVSTRDLSPSSVTLLTQRLAAGDDAAFREFHGRYFSRLYQFLLVLTRGREDEAREALQQTLLRVVRYARAFGAEDAFWSWLKVLARSAARDAGRKQQRYTALLQNFALRWRPSALDPSGDEHDRLHGVLEESLSELELKDRQLVEAKYLDGATVKELSLQAGLTEKAVESRLLRLRRHLRERLLKKLSVQ